MKLLYKAHGFRGASLGRSEWDDIKAFMDERR